MGVHGPARFFFPWWPKVVLGFLGYFNSVNHSLVIIGELTFSWELGA